MPPTFLKTLIVNTFCSGFMRVTECLCISPWTSEWNSRFFNTFQLEQLFKFFFKIKAVFEKTVNFHIICKYDLCTNFIRENLFKKLTTFSRKALKTFIFHINEPHRNMLGLLIQYFPEILKSRVRQEVIICTV